MGFLGGLGGFTRDKLLADATENEVAKLIVDAAYRVHTSLGPGLLESAYEAVLALELDAVFGSIWQTRGVSAVRC
jgi:hypothetical protein